jgi:rhamnose transport system permease protein
VSSETVVHPSDTAAPDGSRSGRSGRLHGLLRWETGLLVLLVLVVVFGASTSSDFLTRSTLFYLGINIGYVAIMALPMTLVIMTGEIDLSVASMLGLSGSTVGLLWHHGWSMWPAMGVALLVGLVGGALNGFLVARVGLPSIAVTIGSLALFRGIAEIMLGSLVVPGLGDRQFPAGLTSIGVSPVVGTPLAWGFVVFLVLALVCGVLLHMTPLGRSLVAMGLQPEAAQFAGIRVALIKFWLYVATGVLSAFAGIIYTLQVSSVSYNAGTGLELNVVAIVLFGGVSIFGGRGTLPGVVLAVLILGSLQMALTQRQVDPNVQNVVTGVLLLLSVVVPSGGEALRRLRARSRHPRKNRPSTAQPTSSPA